MSTTTSELLEIARAAGFDGVEVRAERLLGATAELAEARSRVRPGEVWSLNGLQLQLDTDGSFDRARASVELDPRLEIAATLGASFLLVVPPRTSGADVDRSIAAMREGLTFVTGAANAAHVRVAFEFLGFGDCPINTPALAARVLDGIDEVGIVLDSCHWHASGGGPLDDLDVARIVMVHLNDAPSKEPRLIEDDDRVMPGDGVIRLRALIDSLSAGGYRGPFSLETFNPAYWAEDPMTVAIRGRARLARLFAGGPADAEGRPAGA